VSNAQESLIARRYAKAFYELAAEQKKLETVAGDIDSLRSLDDDGDFKAFLKNPSISRKEQLGVMAAIAKKAKADSVTANFLGVIVENGRLPLLAEILDVTAETIAEHRGELRADVTSARALTDEQVKNLQASLKKATGQDVEMTLHHDETLIGGLKIQLGSLLIDQSVKTRLERLERALKSDTAGSGKDQLRDAA